jgi:hypothetical protein
MIVDGFAVFALPQTAVAAFFMRAASACAIDNEEITAEKPGIIQNTHPDEPLNHPRQEGFQIFGRQDGKIVVDRVAVGKLLCMGVSQFVEVMEEDALLCACIGLCFMVELTSRTQAEKED